MKIHFRLVVLTLLACSALYSQSRIDSTQFYSASLGRDIPVKIYLPTDYSQSAAPYRLYIYLHGSRYSSTDLTNTQLATLYKPVFDAAIESGQIDPIVIAFPKVLFEKAQGVFIPGNRHFYIDSERNGNYESVVSIDLLQWIGTRYNVSTRREARAIGGMQMGNRGAVHMAVRNSDKFIACASHSSFPSIITFLPLIMQETLNEAGGPPYHFSIGRGEFDLIFISAASAYSPNLVNPNIPDLLLDFPIDEQGNLIRSVFNDQWMKHDPATLMKNHNIYRQHVAFYDQISEMDKGLADIWDAELSSLDISHTYDITSNQTVMPTNEEMTSALVFIDRVMDEAAVPTEVFEHDIRLIKRLDQITHFNVYANNIGAPQVWVQNGGTINETNIAVECVLSQSNIQQQTVTVDSLKPLEAKLLTFNMRPEKNADFQVTFTAKLPNDQNAANDKLTLSMTASELVDDFEKGFQLWQTNQDWGVTIESPKTGRFCMKNRPYLTYANNSDTWAIFNGSFNFSKLRDAQLVFHTKHNLAKDDDYGSVEVSVDGCPWAPLGKSYKNSSSKWHKTALSLKKYCGQRFENVAIRFRLVTHSEKIGTGWFIDDIYIKGIRTDADE